MTQRVTRVARMPTSIVREARMIGDPAVAIVVQPPEQTFIAQTIGEATALATELHARLGVNIPSAAASAEALMLTVDNDRFVEPPYATAQARALDLAGLPGLGFWLMIDVTNPPYGYAPAIGNGTNNDQPAIQDLIDAGYTGLYFPHHSEFQPTCVGRYKIQDTVTVPHVTGFHFLGEGGFLADQLGVNRGSSLEWGDPTDYTKPMVHIKASFGMWNGLSLRGNQTKIAPSPPSPSTPRSPDTSKAAAGIHLERPSDGTHGTGKIYFQFLYIEDCVAGFRTGGSSNADVCRFDFIVMRDVTRMWHFAHSNALSWTMGQIHELQCPIIFQCDNGAGRIVHDNLHLHGLGGYQWDTDKGQTFDGQTVLRIGAGGTGTVSGNGSVFHFNNLVDDDASKKWLIDHTSTTSSGDCRVYFTNCDFKNVLLSAGNHIHARVQRYSPGAPPTGNSLGRTLLTFQDCSNLKHLTGNLIFNGDDFYGTRSLHLRVFNCELDGLTSVTGLFNSYSYCNWYGKDNWNWNNPIADETGSKGAP